MTLLFSQQAKEHVLDMVESGVRFSDGSPPNPSSIYKDAGGNEYEATNVLGGKFNTQENIDEYKANFTDTIVVAQGNNLTWERTP